MMLPGCLKAVIQHLTSSMLAAIDASQLVIAMNCCRSSSLAAMLLFAWHVQIRKWQRPLLLNPRGILTYLLAW